MAGFARKIAAENGMDAETGGPITVLSGRIEDIDSLPVQQVQARPLSPPVAWVFGYLSPLEPGQLAMQLFYMR